MGRRKRAELFKRRRSLLRASWSSTNTQSDSWRNTYTFGTSHTQCYSYTDTHTESYPKATANIAPTSDATLIKK
jgi:hypothetical protein